MYFLGVYPNNAALLPIYAAVPSLLKIEETTERWHTLLFMLCSPEPSRHINGLFEAAEGAPISAANLCSWSE